MHNCYDCVYMLVGEKSNDTQSPAYLPAIFDSTKERFSGTKATQMLRRYEAVKRRQQKKDELELEAAEAAEQLRVHIASSKPVRL